MIKLAVLCVGVCGLAAERKGVMNILYLKYAVEVARAGSMNKAAESLFVAQSNLSRAIKELEKDLGIVIFDRNSKGITPTPEGERLIQYSKKILQQIDEVENMFRNEQTKKVTFSISVPRATYIGQAFSEFVKTLSSEEQCEIFYKETNSSRAVNNILHSDYKLGIIRYAEQYDRYFKDMLEQKNLAYELVTEFRYSILANRHSPLFELDEIHEADLENYIEIAHADPYVPSLPVAEVRKEELSNDVKRRVFVFERASELEMLSSNIDLFMWVSPMPQETLERYGLCLRSCPDNTKVYRDVLIYPKDYKLSETDKAFIAELNKAKNNFEKM